MELVMELVLELVLNRTRLGQCFSTFTLQHKAPSSVPRRLLSLLGFSADTPAHLCIPQISHVLLLLLRT